MATKSAAPAKLAERLRAQRIERGLTQKEAAGEIGVSARLYEAWEAGRIRLPQSRRLRLIERWLS